MLDSIPNSAFIKWSKYLRTNYKVRLHQGEWKSILIDILKDKTLTTAIHGIYSLCILVFQVKFAYKTVKGTYSGVHLEVNTTISYYH